MLKRAQAPGFSAPELGIWPASQWNRIDPTRPTRKWDTAWRRLRDIAGLPGLRFHGLRHTIITELAELECGEVSEWLKEHAWKACVGATLPRVRIPPSPPEIGVFLYLQ